MKELLADVTPLRRSPGFRKLFVGQCLTMVGSQVTQVAVPWQVYSASGSPAALGLVGLAALLPIVVFGIYGGAIADSMDRRKLILITSSGSAAGTRQMTSPLWGLVLSVYRPDFAATHCAPMSIFLSSIVFALPGTRCVSVI